MALLAAKVADAADTASPNDAIGKPDCNSRITVSIRYLSSERLYVESADGSTRGGCMTLTEIWEDLDGSAPLYAVDPGSGEVNNTATGTWLLTESLYVQDGIPLQVSHPNEECDPWQVLCRSMCVMIKRVYRRDQDRTAIR